VEKKKKRRHPENQEKRIHGGHNQRARERGYHKKENKERGGDTTMADQSGLKTEGGILTGSV